MTGRPVALQASDGWRLAATVWDRDGGGPGFLLVPASVHERDAYGQTLPGLLAESGTVLAVDIRGRGDSRAPLRFRQMGPGQRRAVRLDVDAAFEYLAQRPSVDPARVALIVEQDSAGPALAAASAGRFAAAALISGRLGSQGRDALRELRAPLLCLVSKEDRTALRDMVDAYLSVRHKRSRLLLFDGIGFGTTMFSAWQFLHRGEQPIEEKIASWLDDVLHGEGARA